MSNPVPSAIALTTIADNSLIIASQHRANYAQIQAAVNELAIALSNGTAGQLLQAVDSSDVQWSSSLSLSGSIMGAFLGITWGSGLTIASGATTATSSGHGINTTDGSTVITINGHSANPILFLENNAGQTINFGTGGNIASAFSLPVGATAFLVWAANLNLWVGVTTSTGMLSTSPSLGIGYRSGAGGTATEAGNNVTLNKTTGQITVSGNTVATGNIYVVNVSNSTVNSTDIPVIANNTITGNFIFKVASVSNGLFVVHLYNPTAGNLNSGGIFNFAIVRGANS